MIVPVILSGGTGVRLWPLSTEAAPKQFVSLVGTGNLFQATLDRVRDDALFADPIIVASERHAAACRRAMGPETGDTRLILEPVARNTAAAIVMAAAVVRDLHGAGAMMLVMPSDHVIDDPDHFVATVTSGVQAAEAGRLVTFGIRPSGPETGYGYIKVGADIGSAPGVREAVRFVEKPEIDVARAMVADGEHLWNAGIFLFRAGSLLDEAARTAPAIADAAQRAIAEATTEGRLIRPDASALAECPSQSIDYAVMEHSRRVAVVPASFGWTDVGSWDAVADLERDAPMGPVTMVDCEGCYVRSDGIEIAALGLRDIMIIASGQRLLVIPRGRSQEVKRLLAEMDSAQAARRSDVALQDMER